MAFFNEFALIVCLALIASVTTYILVRSVFSISESALRCLRVALTRFSPQWLRWADTLFIACTLVTTIVLIAHVTLMYHTFTNGGPDLAVFDQIVWNSLHGRLFETSALVQGIDMLRSGANAIDVYSMPQRTELGNHFAPLLLALVPVYAVFSDPSMLRVIQTLSLIGVVLPLYWFARPQIGRFLALIISIAFLLSPLLPNINAYDFHEISLSPTLFALALFFLLRRQNIPFLVCVFIVLLVKEDVPLLVAGLGLFIFFVQRRRLFGLTVFVLGVMWAIAVVQIVMPYFSPSGTSLELLYPALGSNYAEISHTILTQPILVIQYLLTPQKIAFILHVFVSLAFVSLLGIEVTALAAIPLMESLLGSVEIMYRPFTWYSAPMLPFIFFGAVIGLRRLLAFRPNLVTPPERRAGETIARKVALAVLILTATSVGYYFYSPLPLARNFDLVAWVPSARIEFGHTLLQSIPANVSIAVSDQLLPHVSHREVVYRFPSFPDYRQIDYLFTDTTYFWYNFHKSSWDQVLGTGYFEILSNQDGYILAKRRPLEHPTQIRFDDQIALLGYTVPLTGTIQGGQTLRPITGWRAEQSISKAYVMRVRLLDNAGHIWAQDEREPQESNLSTNRWTPGQFVGDQHALALPVTMPPGDYQIVVAVFDPESNRNLIARDATGRALGETVVLDTVRIEKNKANITASDLQKQFQLEQPLFVDMQEIRLIGFKPLPQTIPVGTILPVGVYWRAREKPRGDYLVAVQLRDATGRVAAEDKNRPAAGAYPTTQWVEGEVLLDWHDVAVPAALAPGEYGVQVVLSDAGSGQVLGEAAVAKISVVGR